ncbi:MAG: 4a-hydroxytetrahydrobiopterin dehydratase [Patescibacteria group bacterium]
MDETEINLTEQKCVPCEGGVDPIVRDDAEILLKHIPDWELASDYASISRKYEFRDFASAIEFVNKVAEIAEDEGHHPDIHLTEYKYVTIVLTTHAIGGLSNNDFILAAKIDA